MSANRRRAQNVGAAGPVLAAAGDREWWHDAACLGYDTDLFFPGSKERATVVKKICATCPVRGECLDDAVIYPVDDDHGVRGGLTAKERHDMRARRAA